jgi:histidinol-phosphate aminotransferase
MGAFDSFLNSLRDEIKNLPLYNAGVTTEYVRSTYHVQQVAKLGSNENFHATSPQVLAAITSAVADVALYPDPFGNELRDALSKRLNVARDRLVLGNGSDDLIAVAVQTFLAPGDEMVTVAPSYGLHLNWPQSIGAHIRAVPVQRNYRLNIDEFVAALSPRTRMVMFSNPSNPVGTSITADDMCRLLSAVGDRTLIVFDEAYFEYAAEDNSYPEFRQMLERSHRPWLLLRTFSKAYGLAGLRIGYALASGAALIHLMDRIRGPFNVNRLALVAAVAALKEADFVQDCISRTIDERERVRQALQALGYDPAPSLANFLFFDAGEDSYELAQRLLPQGVIVKPWREPGFTRHIRVSIGSPRANDQFLAALEKVSGRPSNA